MCAPSAAQERPRRHARSCHATSRLCSLLPVRRARSACRTAAYRRGRHARDSRGGGVERALRTRRAHRQDVRVGCRLPGPVQLPRSAAELRRVSACLSPQSQPGPFCRPSIDPRTRRPAARTQASDPQLAGRRWASGERALIDAAPGRRSKNPRTVVLLSRRVGGFRYEPMFGTLIDHLWCDGQRPTGAFRYAAGTSLDHQRIWGFDNMGSNRRRGGVRPGRGVDGSPAGGCVRYSQRRESCHEASASAPV
jgi:hypothetical protein